MRDQVHAQKYDVYNVYGSALEETQTVCVPAICTQGYNKRVITPTRSSVLLLQQMA